MTSPTLGIINTVSDEELLNPSRPDFTKTLAIDYSADADATVFPLATPVRFSTSDDIYMSKLGTGPLADAVAGIHAQLGVAACDMTVIRTAAPPTEGTTAEQRAAAASAIVTAIGTADEVPHTVNATPRLVHVGETDWLSGSAANPVIAALPALLEKLRGFAVVQAPSDTLAGAVAWRETISSKRIHGVSAQAKVWDTTTSTYVTRPMAPRILGLGIRTDTAMGGYPFDTWCNRPVYGIGGVVRPVAYSLEDGSVEGQQLLAADLGIVVQGEIGVDQAISDGGFTYLGFSSCGTDTDYWTQYHQQRALDYVTVEAMRMTRDILGRRATASRVENWIFSLRAMIADHVVESRLLGGMVEFPIADSDAIAAVLATLTGQTDGVNTVTKFRDGEILGRISIEPAPVIKVVTQNFRRYAKAVEQTLANILAAVSAA